MSSSAEHMNFDKDIPLPYTQAKVPSKYTQGKRGGRTLLLVPTWHARVHVELLGGQREEEPEAGGAHHKEIEGERQEAEAGHVDPRAELVRECKPILDVDFEEADDLQRMERVLCI